MMGRALTYTCILLATAFVFLMASASQPYGGVAAAAADGGTPAERDWETLDKNGGKIHCSNVAESKSGVMLAYIVPCVSKTIENTTIRMSDAMIKWLMPTIYAFIFLVIVLFGVRILQGGGQIHTEGILLILKIMIVLTALELIPTYFAPSLYGVMTEGQAMVADTIGPDVASINCDIAKYRGPQTPLIWAQMDCLMGKLYGFTMGTETDSTGAKKPNMLLASSIFGLLAGFFFGGTFGAIVFLACVGVLWTMFMVVLRTVTGFLNAYLYASLMLIIAPLFVPLILLRVSAQYFEPWWKGILASILMPMILTAYAMFAMLLYDKMLFADDSLIQQLFNNELVKKLEDLPRPICNKASTGNPILRSLTTGLSEDKLYGNNPFFTNFINPMLSAANDQCLGITAPRINPEVLADDAKIGGKTPKEIFTKLFMDMVKLLFLSILVGTGYTNVQSLARRLIGSGSVASVLEPKGALETKFVRLQATAKRSFIGAFAKEGSPGGASGADFIKALGNLPGNMTSRINAALGKD